LYKTLFTTNFTENTYEFYNFVENNNSQRNYLPIKIIKKIAGKILYDNYIIKFLVLISLYL